MCKGKKEVESKEGICPKCGSGLEYGGSELVEEMVCYDVECEKCDWVGEEWHILEFSGHEDK